MYKYKKYKDLPVSPSIKIGIKETIGFFIKNPTPTLGAALLGGIVGILIWTTIVVPLIQIIQKGG